MKKPKIRYKDNQWYCITYEGFHGKGCTATEAWNNLYSTIEKVSNYYCSFKASLDTYDFEEIKWEGILDELE